MSAFNRFLWSSLRVIAFWVPWFLVKVTHQSEECGVGLELTFSSSLFFNWSLILVLYFGTAPNRKREQGISTDTKVINDKPIMVMRFASYLVHHELIFARLVRQDSWLILITGTTSVSSELADTGQFRWHAVQLSAHLVAHQIEQLRQKAMASLYSSVDHLHILLCLCGTISSTSLLGRQRCSQLHDVSFYFHNWLKVLRVNGAQVESEREKEKISEHHFRNRYCPGGTSYNTTDPNSMINEYLQFVDIFRNKSIKQLQIIYKFNPQSSAHEISVSCTDI